MGTVNDLMTEHREAVSYIFWGVMTTVVSLGTYALFVHIGINPSISNILSWLCGVTFAFFTNKFYVFRSKSMERGLVAKEWSLFMGSRIFTGIIAWVLFPFLLWIGLDQDLMGFENMWTKIVTSVVEIIINWVLSKYIVFKHGDADPERSDRPRTLSSRPQPPGQRGSDPWMRTPGYRPTNLSPTLGSLCRATA